ncbi:MAG: zinc-ribbon domain-containing protein [Methanobrevibacter sp.]
MPDYCKNCGAQLNENAKFCPDCGTEAPIKTKRQPLDKDTRNIIIALIAVVAVLSIGVAIASGFFHEVPLETLDFGPFKMDVPQGAKFEEFSSIPAYPGIGGFIFLENKGDYSKEVNMLDVSTLQGHAVASAFVLDRKEGDIEIYKDHTGQSNLKYVFRDMGNYDFGLMGEDTDTMIKMLNTIEITDEASLATQSSATSSGSSSPSSISILGGSFSTGSGDADKTYARINVGKQHSGENVIVQIFYSRDGKSLNNGNMVPATVHSDGYLEISSADAYKYYPDHATIKIYDSSSRLLTTKSVSLMPAAGTQTF